MKRSLSLVLLIFSCLYVKANVRDTIPNGVPLSYPKGWIRYSKQVMADSGFATLFIDTTARPKYPMFGIARYDSSIWWFNMVKWQRLAAPEGLYVKYGDSTITFVTPTQMNDSLGNFVTLKTSQRVDADKTWKAIQTFSNDIASNRQITNKIDSAEENSFIKIDSLQNTGFDFSNQFRNILRNLNYSSLHLTGVPNVVVVDQSLTIYKAGDTLNDLLAGRGGLTSLLRFIKKNNAEDTLNISNINATGALKAFVPSFSITGDTGNISDNSTFWDINIPIALMYGNTSVTNHGYTPVITDLEVGHTDYLDNSGNSDSAYQVGLHRGVVIDALLGNGNNINQKAIALDQLGTTDTVRFKTSKLIASNLATATTAYQLFYDPTTGLVTYDAVPTAFNNNQNNNNIYSVSYKQNVLNEMLKSATIKVVKKKHRTIIIIEK